MTVAQSSSPKLAAPAAKVEASSDPVEAIPEPKKREEKKAEPVVKRDLKAVMSGWSSDEAE